MRRPLPTPGTPPPLPPPPPPGKRLLPASLAMPPTPPASSTFSLTVSLSLLPTPSPAFEPAESAASLTLGPVEESIRRTGFAPLAASGANAARPAPAATPLMPLSVPPERFLPPPSPMLCTASRATCPTASRTTSPSSFAILFPSLALPLVPEPVPVLGGGKRRNPAAKPRPVGAPGLRAQRREQHDLADRAPAAEDHHEP